MRHLLLRSGLVVLLAAGMVAPSAVATFSTERVIIQIAPGHSPADIRVLVERAGGSVQQTLDIINAQVVDLPVGALAPLSRHPFIAGISPDRSVAGTMERTAATIGATTVRNNLGYDGSGVGVAIIDSGITAWHDDLASPGGGQRIAQFVDFSRNRPQAYDDYGHGTHVAGIIAGDGFDSGGARMGVAPGASLTILKVLDEDGNGRISDVIAAFDYILKKGAGLNIRVVNLSVATGVYESYMTDPLTLAAKRLVDAGIVVIAAAGNHGWTANGEYAYGGVTSPGNAPWVLTVGASSHMGTTTRKDDRMAAFSSRGPTAFDFVAKPDLVAPGVGIESLSNPDSRFYQTMSPYLLPGTMQRGFLPYLSLTGTSMSAPVVTGTVALMLQANPALTPNAVKAILQYTAQVDSGYDPLTQGAGFLDAAGAVEMSLAFADRTRQIADSSSWSRHVIWGNQRIRGGRLAADGSAWATGVTWGAARTPAGQNVDWGVHCQDANCDRVTSERWSAVCADAACQTFDWGTARNIVWGGRCGGNDCREQWTVAAARDESVVWGTAADESVVWGTTFSDESVVWGTSIIKRSIVWPR
ncbi:MAG TPA: S8 family peptidase [Vicinamibacterales bacterium]|nr:S8 family peptidase [Vicinamibacterales bacterium]